MTTKELLKDAEDIFRKIDEFVTEEQSLDFSDALTVIESATPPESWVIELPSKAKQGETYKTIPVDVMEAAAKRIFGEACLVGISQPIITQDKNGRFSATVQIEYQCGNMILPGVASVFAADISLLELAVPKASTMAVKNALKQLGGLFGKYLNRSEDQTELPAQKEEPKLTTEDLAQMIAGCKTVEELKSYRLVAYAKGNPLEIQDLYETKLRTLNKKQ